MRRNSYFAGEQELAAWKRHNRFSPAVRNTRIRLVKAWNMHPEQKAKGRRRGPLSFHTLHVYDIIMSFRDYVTGACFPSVKGIARRANVSLGTVEKALTELGDEGLLGRMLRTRPIDDPVPGGPRVEQITTAYWFLVPAWLAKGLRAAFGSAPKPDDQTQREADEAEQVTGMLATLSTEELAAFHAGDQTIVAKALSALARAVDRRSRAIPTCRNYQGQEG